MSEAIIRTASLIQAFWKIISNKSVNYSYSRRYIKRKNPEYFFTRLIRNQATGGSRLD